MTIERISRLVPVALLAVTVFAQSAEKGAATKSAAATTTASKPAAPPLEPGLYANIATSMGVIKVKLFEKESPITVKNFQDLALGRKAWADPKTGQRVTRPLYTGTIFHRVIPDFMIQGGDPTGTGMGGTDVIPDEFHPSLSFDQPGRLAMANAGPGTGSCQFFITEVPTPHLNGRHTIFGQVVDNQELVGKIARVPKSGEKPATPVRIVRISFQRVGPGPAVPGARPASGTKAGTKSGAATKTGTATKSATKAPAKEIPPTSKQ